MNFYDLRAMLYDVAFSWDVGEEIDWLISRLGPSSRSLLEPGCGSGRMFPDFAKRGIEVSGIDLSPVMLERAKERMRDLGLPEPSLLQADMADFDLEPGRRFDGAYCPINSLGYLPDLPALHSHLCCVAKHLTPGGKYLVQLDLRDTRNFVPQPADDTTVWEMEAYGRRVQTSWYGRSWDPVSRIETQVSRFEVLNGPEAGSVLEDEHRIRVFDWRDWTDALAGTGFAHAASFDGSKATRLEVEVGPGLEQVRLAWHELTREA